MTEENGFYSDSRWNNLYAYADTLKDMVRAGGDPLEETLVTLSLILEQFPESPPITPESLHINCVNHLLRVVLGAIRKEKMRQLKREQAGECETDEAPEGPRR
ncbi:MAG: hypothetical protein KKC99_05155 [Proteobacteria bacterium]|nr:hypothetical protein [Pseudomonadota bacterium]